MAKMTFRDNQLSQPKWAGDFLSPDNLMRFPARVDADQFSDANGVRVVANGISAIGATTITVDTLARDIPDNTVLDFGGAKFARVTATARAGATTISVTALVNALADNDVAIYSQGGRKFIKNGTLLGRTYTERDNRTGFGPAASTDDEFFILAFDIEDADNNPDCELYRPGRTVKENYLPDWDTITANSALKTALRAKYQCITGVD